MAWEGVGRTRIMMAVYLGQPPPSTFIYMSAPAGYHVAFVSFHGDVVFFFIYVGAWLCFLQWLVCVLQMVLVVGVDDTIDVWQTLELSLSPYILQLKIFLRGCSMENVHVNY